MLDDVYIKYVLAGMPQKDWESIDLMKLRTPELRAKLADVLKDGQVICLLGDSTPGKTARLLAIIETLEELYPDFVPINSNEICYCTPSTNFYEIIIGDKSMLLVMDIDLVPPLQIQAMRAVVDSAIRYGLIVILTAQDTIPAAKALGPVYTQIPVWIRSSDKFKEHEVRTI